MMSEDATPPPMTFQQVAEAVQKITDNVQTIDAHVQKFFSENGYPLDRENLNQALSALIEILSQWAEGRGFNGGTIMRVHTLFSDLPHIYEQFYNDVNSAYNGDIHDVVEVLLDESDEAISEFEDWFMNYDFAAQIPPEIQARRARQSALLEDFKTLREQFNTWAQGVLDYRDGKPLLGPGIIPTSMRIEAPRFLDKNITYLENLISTGTTTAVLAFEGAIGGGGVDDDCREFWKIISFGYDLEPPDGLLDEVEAAGKRASDLALQLEACEI